MISNILDMMSSRVLGQMRACVTHHEETGSVVAGSGIATNFPKNPPPTGIAYSKNFARFQRDGMFAAQTKD